MLLFKSHNYQAEESGNGSTSGGSDTSPVKAAEGFTAEQMAEMIKQNVSASMKELTAELAAQNTPPPQQKQEDPDLWDTIIDPRINRATANSNLKSEAAEDKLDFYTSDFWLEDIEEVLVEEDPDKRKVEKAKLREKIENNFKAQLRAGKGLPRADIAKHAIGEKVTEDRVKFHESIGKKQTKKRESELDKARRGADISVGNMANVSAQDIFKMSHEEVEAKYGNVPF